MSDKKTVFILCEKPDAAMRIAKALENGNSFSRKTLYGVPYYEVDRGNEKLLIVSALGHLYTMSPNIANREIFPVFDFSWAPRYLVERGAKKTKTWINVISKLSKKAQEFILATDYDIEGATLGYTILKYACGGKEKEAKRMKFSTLTTNDLRKAYESLLPHIEFPVVEAGLCRHFLDALYGINLSRAMTVSAKNWSGKYSTLSIGRVQGPTLKFLVDREKEINSFIPTPYWSIKAKIKVKGSIYEAEYEKEIIRTKSEADLIVDSCKNKIGKISHIKVKKILQKPPTPFDLGALQTEAYALFKYTPKRTLEIAERLYLSALISYPRTSSQKLPPSINYVSILESLKNHPEYRDLAGTLLTKDDLTPREGKKDDPAHPAIYPTGNLPERDLSPQEKRIWDLIVRRFMAVFGSPALKQSVKVSISIGEHTFYLRGRRILDEGWIKFYRPYVRVDEVILPELKVGDQIEFLEVLREDKFTRPPPRHNPSSLLKKMEAEGIGTKSTRADIIETLYERGYISGERITVSELGFDVIDLLDRYCPEVISVSLTKDLEESMDRIQSGNEKMENVMLKAIERLKPIFEEIKRYEKDIGRELSESIKKARLQERILGQCLTCGTGKLIILRSRRSGKRFVGCTNFFNGLCKTSFPLPQKGSIKPLHRSCSKCGWPLVQVKIKGKRPWILCINPECPSKKAG